MKITLKTSCGNIFGIANSWEAANKIAKSVWTRNVWSDLYYCIELGTEEIDGVIDLEPRSFHEYHRASIVTTHLRTFWTNISQLTEEKFGITFDDIKTFKNRLTLLPVNR